MALGTFLTYIQETPSNFSELTKEMKPNAIYSLLGLFFKVFQRLHSELILLKSIKWLLKNTIDIRTFSESWELDRIWLLLEVKKHCIESIIRHHPHFSGWLMQSVILLFTVMDTSTYLEVRKELVMMELYHAGNLCQNNKSGDKAQKNWVWANVDVRHLKVHYFVCLGGKTRTLLRKRMFCTTLLIKKNKLIFCYA